jgi:hypothetical protein
LDDNKENPLISFWDFGGQAIMHSMHEFFLGERCVYVVVMDGRRDEKPEYWLDIIGQYGRNSSVIMVMNKIDQNKASTIDQIRILRDYNNTFQDISFHSVSCKLNKRIEELTDDIIKKAANSVSSKKYFPGRWYRIKEKLVDMNDSNGNPRNYIREDQYRSICSDEGITEASPQNVLLNWMNDLGICFSYNSIGHSGAVNEIKVLRPEWITNGVYKIITSKEAKDNNGFISHDEIEKILLSGDDVNAVYRNTEVDFVLGMMRDFKLSYQVEQHEFIPMLTVESEPDLDPLPDATHLQIRYTVPIPAYVLYNLIVQMKNDADRVKTWRNGVFFNNQYDGSRAIVRFGKDRSILDIFTDGYNKTNYLAYIQRNLHDIQSKLNISFDEYIEYKTDKGNAYIKLERLLKMWKRGIEEDYDEDTDSYINIIDVLSTIAPHEVINKLNNKIKEHKQEIRYLKESTTVARDLRDGLFQINEKLDDISQILRLETERIKSLLENTAQFSQEQFNGIIERFEALKNDSKDEQIISVLNEILDEARKTNTKGLKDKLIAFIGIAGGITSISTAGIQILASIYKG